MRASYFCRIFALAIAVVLATIWGGTAHAQDSHPFAGTWKMVSSTDDGTQTPWTLVVRYADGKYSATASVQQDENPAGNLKVDGNSITFTVPYQGEDYEIKLKLVQDKLTGTFSGNGVSGDTKGERATAT